MSMYREREKDMCGEKTEMGAKISAQDALLNVNNKNSILYLYGNFKSKCSVYIIASQMLV